MGRAVDITRATLRGLAQANPGLTPDQFVALAFAKHIAVDPAYAAELVRYRS